MDTVDGDDAKSSEVISVFVSRLVDRGTGTEAEVWSDTGASLVGDSDVDESELPVFADDIGASLRVDRADENWEDSKVRGSEVSATVVPTDSEVTSGDVMPVMSPQPG